jgi:hypothetical protein
MLSQKLLAAKRWARELKRRHLRRHRHRVGMENWNKERLEQEIGPLAALPKIPEYTPRPEHAGLGKRIKQAFRRRATRGSAEA